MTSRLRLVLATSNSGKIVELKALLGDLGVDVLSLAAFPNAPKVSEDFSTYAENAAAKAHAIARHTGLPAVADDSGLEVDALGGRPGVHSARFAGEPSDDRRNLEQLLRLLVDVPSERRSARFRCVMVVALPDSDRTLVAEGSVDGWIAMAPRGAGGFGYDPVFVIPSLGRTVAQISADEKHRISHRGQACARLREHLVPFLRASQAS